MLRILLIITVLLSLLIAAVSFSNESVQNEQEEVNAIVEEVAQNEPQEELSSPDAAQEAEAFAAEIEGAITSVEEGDEVASDNVRKPE